MLRISAELRDRLRDQDIEPIQTLGLVSINVIISF
jgi:hypothetical protein